MRWLAAIAMRMMNCAVILGVLFIGGGLANARSNRPLAGRRRRATRSRARARADSAPQASAIATTSTSYAEAAHAVMESIEREFLGRGDGRVCAGT